MKFEWNLPFKIVYEMSTTKLQSFSSGLIVLMPRIYMNIRGKEMRV